MRILTLGLILLFIHTQGDPKPGDDVRVRVATDGWGGADPADIGKVLQSAGASLWQHVTRTEPLLLEVSRTKSDPITLFERSSSGAVRIKLNAEGLHWSQYAFQFGHEIGHVLCGFADYPNPNLWFEETICEVASLFALGRMAKAWETDPPYPNWKTYSASLLKYREERLAKSGFPDGKPVSEWFREHEESLRKDPRQRDRNLLLASALLPLFEEDPGRWDAMGTLNALRGKASRSFPQYLKDWSSSAPVKHRSFIRAVADRFGVAIDP